MPEIGDTAEHPDLVSAGVGLGRQRVLWRRRRLGAGEAVAGSSGSRVLTLTSETTVTPSSVNGALPPV